MKARKLCPIRNDKCLGRECAMAVKIDHPLLDPYYVVWKCGLVNDPDIINHGQTYVIDSKEK